MAINIKRALTFLKRSLDKDWGKIDFKYSQESKDEIKATAEVTLNGFDDDIMLIINGYAGGGTSFRAVFDKIEKNPQTLALVNEFNDNNAFFKAFIRTDGYLELCNFFICFDECMYRDYGSEFLYRVVDLQKNDTMKKLSALTK